MGVRTYHFGPLLCSGQVFFTLFATTSVARAQEPSANPPPPTAQADNKQPEEIIVIGSRIPHTNLTAISPVTMVDKAEVKLSGAILTEDLLNALPQVVPDQGAFISNGSSGTSTVDLRGLGAGRTLVLINGRRLLPGDPFYPVPDINAVPSALIKRVEVLTGGASAVYGSDAIAGAVNFVLDTELDGFRIDAQASFFQHNNRDGSDLGQALVRRGFAQPKGNTVDGGNQDIDVAYGLDLGDGRGHATFYAGYRKLSAVTEDSRDYSACAAQGRLNSNTFDCGGSFASEPGTFFTNFLPFHVVSGREFEVGVTRYNYAPLNYYQRSGRRYIAGAFADYELSSAINPFVELMWMDDRTTAQVAPSAAFGDQTDINCDNPLLSQQQRDLICFFGNYVGQIPVFDDEDNLIEIFGEPEQFVDPVTGNTYLRGTLFPLRRNVEGGPRIADLRHKDMRLVGGVKGDISDNITYEASLLFGRVKYRSAGFNDLSITRQTRALDVIIDPATGAPACRSKLTGEDPSCVPWDIFAPGMVTAEALSYLSLSTKQHGGTKQLVATTFANIDLGEWGIRSGWSDENPTLNIGAEYRKDSLDFEPDEFFTSGDIAGGDVGVSPIHGETKVKELFAEARIPLVSNRTIYSLLVEAGYRQSWQSNPANKFSVNSYKLGLEFAPIRDIRLRASIQRAVRAPNVQELFFPIFDAGFREDPCTGGTPHATLEQCQNTGVTPEQYGHILPSPDPDNIPYQWKGGGNTALDPETATTKAIGAVISPRFIPRLNLTVDWFDITVKNSIGVIGATATMRNCIETGEPVYCDRIHRDSNGSLWLTPQGFLDNRLTNFYLRRARGVDVGVYYQHGFGRLGSLDTEFLGSRMARDSTIGGLFSFECAGAYGVGCGVPKPKWRHKLRATWQFDDRISASVQWRYYGSVRLERSIPGNPNINGPWRPGDEKIGAQNFFDLTAQARIASAYEFRIGVKNLLDREPPIVSGSSNDLSACPGTSCNGNTFPQLYDPLGRYLFAGVTVNF